MAVIASPPDMSAHQAHEAADPAHVLPPGREGGEFGADVEWLVLDPDRRHVSRP